MTRTIDEYIVAHQLSIILIRCEHICLDTLLTCFCGQGTNHIVSFKTFHFENRNVPSLQDILNDWNALLDILWCRFALGLVSRVGLTTERRSMRIEGHTKMGGLLLGEHFLKGIQKAHNGTCIKSFRVNTWVLDKGVIRTVNERVGV